VGLKLNYTHQLLVYAADDVTPRSFSYTVWTKSPVNEILVESDIPEYPVEHKMVQIFLMKIDYSCMKRRLMCTQRHEI
jgi:hypothetical protein